MAGPNPNVHGGASEEGRVGYASNDADLAAAEAQAPDDSELRPPVPTGKALGRPETEVSRNLDILHTPRQDQAQAIGRAPTEQDVIDHQARTQGPRPQESPAQQPDLTKEELAAQNFLFEGEASPQPRRQETDPAEGDFTVDLGGEQVRFQEINDWRDTHQNYEELVRDIEDRETALKEKEERIQKEDQGMAGALAFMRDPATRLQGLAAIGITPAMLQEDLSRSGFMANPSLPPNGTEATTTAYQHLPEPGEDADPLTRALYQQNQALMAHMTRTDQALNSMQQNMQHSEEVRMHTERIKDRTGRIKTATNAVTEAYGRLRNGSIDERLGNAIVRLTEHAIEEGIDDAPMEEAGLKSWAARQFRRVASDLGARPTTKVVKGSRRASTQTRAAMSSGRTLSRQAAPEVPQQQQEDFSFEDDDSRLDAGARWMIERAKQLGYDPATLGLPERYG